MVSVPYEFNYTYNGRYIEIAGHFDAVEEELSTALGKFPPFNSSHEGYAVILEELDELWDEIKNNKAEGSHERQIKEAKQVAAMAIRFMIDITEKNFRNERERNVED